MADDRLVYSAPATSKPHSGLSALRVNVSFPGSYFLALVVSMLFAAYEFAQNNAYYFSLCLLGVSLISLINGLYQIARLNIRLPSSMLVMANMPFSLPVNSNIKLVSGECSLGLGQWLKLHAASRDGRYKVLLPPQQRGVYRLTEVQVRRACALGVFYLSKKVALDSLIYVYPQSDQPTSQPWQDNDSLDLHPYRQGEAVHRIDWRGAARGRELHSYRSSEQQAQDIYLKLNPAADLEQELTRLSAEVLARGKMFTHFGLQLGHRKINAGQGETHVTRCLQQLAEYSNEHLAKERSRQLSFSSGDSPAKSEEQSHGDTLANKGLLFLCAVSSLSVYIFDPLWLPIAFCLATLMWRLFRVPLSPSWRNQIVLSLFIVIGAAFQCLYIGSVFSFFTAVSYLCFALGSKLLFFQSRRDALATVSLFCLISGMAFYNSDHPVQVLLGLTSLFSGVLYVFSVQQPDINAYRISALLSAAIVIASATYAVMPPPEKALWQLPLSRQNSSIGLADEVTPGSMSNLSSNHRIVFRARLSPQLARISEFFWRASVFENFDGQAWRHGNEASFTWAGATRLGNAGSVEQSDYRYSVEFESRQDERLFSLDIGNMQSRWDIDHIESDQGEYFLSFSQQQLQRYSVSLAPYAVEAKKPHLDARQAKRYLQLPPAVAPKTRRMVNDWLQQNSRQASPKHIVSAALAFFAREGFVYSTENVNIKGDLVDGFVFGERKGYCEHYASAFVLMMRAAGIPARVVTGYSGAEYQGDGDIYVVRQSFAHAWAEVWMDDTGWLRFDPTAYVSATVDSASAAAKYWSALAKRIAESLSWFRDINPEGLLPPLLALLLMLVALPWLKRLSLTVALLPNAVLNKPGQVLETAAAACFRQLMLRCQRHGIAINDSDDIETCAEKISSERPDLFGVMKEFSNIYNNLRYSQDKAWGQLQRLRELLIQIKL